MPLALAETADVPFISPIPAIPSSASRLTEAPTAAPTGRSSNRRSDYDALRVRLGVPEGGKDYDFGDAYPHEADFDLFNGVSFSEGLLRRAGSRGADAEQDGRPQAHRENPGDGAADSGTDVLLGEAVIGRVGTVDGQQALAMLRLDRASKRSRKPKAHCGRHDICADPDALARYRATAAARPRRRSIMSQPAEVVRCPWAALPAPSTRATTTRSGACR